MLQRMTRRMFSVSLLAVLAVLATGMAAVTAASFPSKEPPVIRTSDPGNQPIDGLAGLADCRKTFTSGTGEDKFEWCFSSDGNVVQIEHGDSQEHVGIGTKVEGFCLSASGTRRGITVGGPATEGLEAPTYPGDAKVAHVTTDGDLRVVQQFIQQAANRQINIVMTVENKTDAPLNNVYVTRFIDADLNSSSDDDQFRKGPTYAVALKPDEAHLQLYPQSTQFDAYPMLFNTFAPHVLLNDECFFLDGFNRSEYTGDGSMAVLVNLGTIGAGQSKQVKFLYRISV